MAIKTASFEATCTIGLLNAATKVERNSFKVEVSHSATPQVALFSWDFSVLNAAFSDITTEIANSVSITGISVDFWHNLAQDALGLELLEYTSTTEPCDPGQSAGDIDTAINTTSVLATLAISSASQTQVSVPWTDSVSIFSAIRTDIGAGSAVSVAIRRDDQYDGSVGSVDLGGLDLTSGGAEWRATDSGEVPTPPVLVITYEITDVVNPTLDMKFTTSDPSTTQSSPGNSLGGHASSNNVYSSVLIANSINTVQVTIPVDADDTLPSAGTASVGPEFFVFNSINSVTHSLTGVVRSSTPFPAGFDSYGAQERIFILSPDSNGLNLLFNTRPGGDLVQYRCIAVINEDTSSEFRIKNVFAGITQKAGADVQIAVGVEVPKFDAHLGNIDSAASTTTFIDATFSEANGFATGFFNGAFIKFLDLGLNEIVSSFDDGEFILASAVTGLAAQEDFVITPAPSQTVANDATSPSKITGRFSGFSEDGSAVAVNFVEDGKEMTENDVFYVWLRRTATANVTSGLDAGAVLVLRFEDSYPIA